MSAFFADSEAGFTKFLEELAWLGIEKLSSLHDLAGFNCGDDEADRDLDAFLKEDALRQQVEHANVTYVAVSKGTGKVIGFVTILNDKLRVSSGEKKDLAISSRYFDFPAIKIGKLAVSKEFKGKKIGTTLLRYVVGLALESAEKTGCRFLIVDSIPKSVEFYLKKGFVKNLVQDQRKTMVVLEKPDGSLEPDKEYIRETVSLRLDLTNPVNKK
ncbi:MAG: GNAT family N-acetyltransferase [Candidatus Diapherotrites archaeon]